MTGRPMLYADATTSAVVDVVDRYRDRAAVAVGSRYRVDASTVVTVDRVTYAPAGHVARVSGLTDDGIRAVVTVDPDALARPFTLADDIDRARSARRRAVLLARGDAFAAEVTR